MKLQTVTPVLFLMAVFFIGCQEKDVGNRGELTMATYASMHNKSMVSDSLHIRHFISKLVETDTDSMPVDAHVRAYYREGRPFLWIDRPDLYPQMVDTLKEILYAMHSHGFKPEAFKADRIDDDLRHLDSLRFDTANYQIDRVLARLEYNLTKGYLRLVTGNRYGYFNPTKIFNHLYRDDFYVGKTVYRRVFDIPIEHPDSMFYERAYQSVGEGEGMLHFIEDSWPEEPFYGILRQQLDTVAAASSRNRILCNMERCRWRQLDNPREHQKRVVVNIPAYRVWAYDKDTVFTMKIVCGAKRTKTPLLTSRINRMEMNPLWIIPRSIIEKEIVHHIGDSAYFARNHYYIKNKQTGDTIPPQELNMAIIKSPNYTFAQERGAGNSLGRIIFRFPNDFAVYLHDTNSPSVFQRENRAVSHGCVRLERPFDMARFLLDDKNAKTLEKIRYSMRANLKNKESIDKEKMLSALPVEPAIPVFITYYTLFAGSDSTIHAYPDVYGYDAVISNYLKNYTE